MTDPKGSGSAQESASSDAQPAQVIDSSPIHVFVAIGSAAQSFKEKTTGLPHYSDRPELLPPSFPDSRVLESRNRVDAAIDHNSETAPRPADRDPCLEITRGKWNPKEVDEIPNPWLDIANFAPAPHGGTEQEHKSTPFRFTSLPVEILYYLAKHLPRESAVALALVNRAMFCLLGPRFLQGLSTQEHWNLLLLLERDSDMMVACQQCRKLYSPFVALPNTKCLTHGPGRYLACSNDPTAWISHRVAPAYCRLLAKRYIRQQPYSELLAMASGTKTYTLLPDFTLFHTSTVRIVNGRLLLRHETLIAPLTPEGHLTSRAAFLLDEIASAGSDGLPLCPHIKWKHLGVDLSLDRSVAARRSRSNTDWYTRAYGRGYAFKADDRYATNHEAEAAEDTDFTCDGSPHYWICYDETPIPTDTLNEALGPALWCGLLHNQPCDKSHCNDLIDRYKVNLVRGCEICETDVCVSAQDVEGLGRVLGLTTWKNLGGIHDSQWAAWYAHHQNVYEFTRFFNRQSFDDRAKMWRDLSKGTSIYSAFENIGAPSSGVVPAYWYKPVVSRRAVAHLTGASGIPETDWRSHDAIFAT